MKSLYQGFSARAHSAYPIVHNFLDPAQLPPEVAGPLTAAERHWKDPFVGVTTDGTVVAGLYPLEPTGIDTSDTVERAKEFLAALTPEQRNRTQLPVDAPQWRLWTNAIPTWLPTTGILLEDIDESSRSKACALLAACMSADGYREVRTAMKLNAALGELIDDYRDTLREFMYQITIFGEPSVSGPWGWQLAGHHVDLHCLMIGGQMVFAPVFLGAEPAAAVGGTYDGLRLFDLNQSVALQLRESLNHEQEAVAVLSTSIRHDSLPPQLADPHNGRHQGGMGRDNVVIPYAGIAAGRLTAGQQEILLRVIGLYIDRMPRAHSALKRRAVEQHLPKTYFAWRGGAREGDAFYYRIHSPVLLIEFDHHVGAFLDNDEPQPFHCHTIVREPNGNDYGKDLLRQHLERWH